MILVNSLFRLLVSFWFLLATPTDSNAKDHWNNIQENLEEVSRILKG